MLGQVLPAEIFAILLIFVRVGAAMMLLPGYAEPYVLPRIRLLLALMISLAVSPVLAKPAFPK